MILDLVLKTKVNIKKTLPLQIIGSEFVKNYGGIVKTIDFEKGYSTSSIIKNILKYS